MNYVAEDGTAIRARMEVLQAEREQAAKNRDPEQAAGAFLDRVAEDYGESRHSCESDYTFRARLLRKIRGET